MQNLKFNAYELIDKKKHGKNLTKDEIKWFIQSLMDKTIQDYQMSAMLMAMFLKGMSKEETAFLTDAMLYSGATLKFSGKNVIDKHSTGGIGDKTSFILAPIAAAAGILVPMMAGRSLGFTGGTIDKIECVKGFKTNLSLDEFQKHLINYGLVLIGQTEQIAPADKIIYGLRDVTATIDSIPLITASIMSKKLAEGANGVVMDIKCGNGAFMRNPKDAKKLGHSILDTAKRFKKKCTVLITDMNQPLGTAVGNTLEILESVEVLRGKGDKDLTDLSVELAAHMILLGGVAKNLDQARKKAWETITSGSALAKFKEMIEVQGGDAGFIKNPAALPLASQRHEFLAAKNGYIKSYQSDQIGLMLVELGGGRKVKTDQIDYGVGFIFHKKIGDQVKKGESLVTVYHNPQQLTLVKDLEKKFNKEILQLSAAKTKRTTLIYDTIK